MWKSVIFGIIAGVAIAILANYFPLQGNHHQANEAGMNGLNTVNRSPGKQPRLMKIDSIGRHHRLMKELGNEDSVTTLNHGKRAESHYLNNQVAVKFKNKPDQEDLATIEKEIHGQLVNRHDQVYVFSSESENAAEMVLFFDDRENVIYAEPNYIMVPNAHPNDALYERYQWNLPMIATEEGWDLSQGSENVVIAVIDTGVDLDHPDLADRLIQGYNVLADNNHPNDTQGHGTHVAGIIASETNNRRGTAGITWYNQIMPIKVIGRDGTGTSIDVAKGIKWATDHGADVINMSLGNYQPSKILREAVQYANKHDVVLVAATGNDSTDRRDYPAAYPGVLGISAVNKNGDRARFSNYGDYVDVVAPGVNIASTYIGGEYAALSGTSMAAPHVTALAGLIRSYAPGLSNQEVINIIKKTAADLGNQGRDDYYGTGIIDVANALQAVYQEAPGA